MSSDHSQLKMSIYSIPSIISDPDLNYILDMHLVYSIKKSIFVWKCIFSSILHNDENVKCMSHFEQLFCAFQNLLLNFLRVRVEDLGI